MANNRLYILDTETGEKILIAKGWGTWAFRRLRFNSRRSFLGELQEWLDHRDIGSASGPDGAETKLKLVTE